MFLRSTYSRLLKATALLLVPAVLIVGANFIANSKTESQVTSFRKATFKRTVTVPPSVIFEADEELEDDDLTDAHVLLKEIPGLHGIVLARETPRLPQTSHSLYQIEYSLNPRAPPAL